MLANNELACWTWKFGDHNKTRTMNSNSEHRAQNALCGGTQKPKHNIFCSTPAINCYYVISATKLTILISYLHCQASVKISSYHGQKSKPIGMKKKLHESLYHLIWIMYQLIFHTIEHSFFPSWNLTTSWWTSQVIYPKIAPY